MKQQCASAQTQKAVLRGRVGGFGDCFGRIHCDSHRVTVVLDIEDPEVHEALHEDVYAEAGFLDGGEG
jgi:hypothetical protein